MRYALTTQEYGGLGGAAGRRASLKTAPAAGKAPPEVARTSKPTLTGLKPAAAAAATIPGPSAGSNKLAVPAAASAGPLSPQSASPTTPEVHFAETPVERTNKLNHVRPSATDLARMPLLNCLGLIGGALVGRS